MKVKLQIIAGDTTSDALEVNSPGELLLTILDAIVAYGQGTLERTAARILGKYLGQKRNSSGRSLAFRLSQVKGFLRGKEVLPIYENLMESAVREAKTTPPPKVPRHLEVSIWLFHDQAWNGGIIRCWLPSDPSKAGEECEKRIGDWWETIQKELKKNKRKLLRSLEND